MNGGLSKDAPSYPAAYVKLTATDAAVPLARLLVAEALTFWELAEDEISTARLVMSELATNAVRASTGLDRDAAGEWSSELPLIAPQVRVDGRSLFVEVWDASPRMPLQRTPDNNAEGGRGLLLVGELTDRWAVSEPVSGGKVVYARLGLEHPPPVSIFNGCEVPLSDRLMSAHMIGCTGQHAMANQALSARLYTPLTML